MSNEIIIDFDTDLNESVLEWGELKRTLALVVDGDSAFPPSVKDEIIDNLTKEIKTFEKHISQYVLEKDRLANEVQDN